MPAAASHAARDSAGGPATTKGAGKSAPQSAASGGAIADRITANPGLFSKVTDLLPAGTTLQSASVGFKNLGQFLAALHVSHNLNIPFDTIKAEMTSGKSLGQAISDLNPNITKSAAKGDLKSAESQARQDLRPKT